LSIVTRQGTPLVHEGDQVKKGDLLVNGRLDLKNDAGEVTGYRYCQAQADITGEYQISYEDTMEREFEIRSYQYERNNLVRQEELFLRAGDRIFSFGRLKNNYQEYDYYVEESQLTVGENFSLPLFWGRRMAVPCSVRQENYTDSQLQQL